MHVPDAKFPEKGAGHYTAMHYCKWQLKNIVRYQYMHVLSGLRLLPVAILVSLRLLFTSKSIYVGLRFIRSDILWSTPRDLVTGP